MGATLHVRAERVLSALHRHRASGERFMRVLRLDASAPRMRVAAVPYESSAADLQARHGPGPLRVVLGDGASPGASTEEARRGLRFADAWDAGPRRGRAGQGRYRQTVHGAASLRGGTP